jgi:hypothetical protein
MIVACGLNVFNEIFVICLNLLVLHGLTTDIIRAIKLSSIAVGFEVLAKI